MRRTGFVVAAVMCSFTGLAHGDNARAEELFRSGRQLVKEGNFAAACAAFAASQDLEPNVNTLLNLGDCEERAQRYASAWRAFVAAEQATHGRPDDAALNKVADERARALEKRLSFLHVSVPDATSAVSGLAIMLDGKPLSDSYWNAAVAVDAGDHDLVARAPGFDDQRLTVTVDGEAARASAAFGPMTPSAVDDVGPGSGALARLERNRLYAGVMFGTEEIRSAAGGDTTAGIEAGYHIGLATHVFARVSGGVRYQNMSVGPGNAIAFHLNPSIGYLFGGRWALSFEPSIGTSSAGKQLSSGGGSEAAIENEFGPFYRLATLTGAYVHDGRHELALTANLDDVFGFHSETMQLSVAFRVHR